jgi:hypothetical protein
MSRRSRASAADSTAIRQARITGLQTRRGPPRRLRYRIAPRLRLAVAVILTKRQRADDVFLIGEETLLGQEAGVDSDATATTAPQIGGPQTPPPAARSHANAPSSLHGARGLALLGLGAALSATLGVLELGGRGDTAPHHRHPSAHSPLISRSPVSPPAAPRPARPSVVHHHRPRHKRPRRHRRAVVFHPGEPEREPTRPVAPVSSPVEATPPPPAPAPVEAAPPAPPSPAPPSSSGGAGSGSVETFGFQH